MAVQEVAITCCLNDTVVSACAWDVQTGTSLITYRGDTPITPVGLSVLSDQYVVAALQDKPFLRVWPVNSQQPLSSLRLVCPGRVTHAQTSPDSCYIALTVADKLHIYQVGSGQLLGTGVRHFQPIRVIRWSHDGSLVACGGEDGLVTVWPLAILISSQNAPEPRHVFSDHTLPVTDLIITGGLRPRLLSVSADHTCKIYDVSEGTLLLSMVFDHILTAVTISALETQVFVGTDSGAIWQLGMLSPPRHLEYHVTATENVTVFTGHTKAVRCLSTSFNGDLLMSGSADSSVKIWHITSCQCLRTLTLKGPVTNAFFTSKPKQMFDNELKPSIVINSFQTANSEAASYIDVMNEHSLSLCDDNNPKIRNLFPAQASNSSEERLKSLQMEIDLLRSINSNLYKFSVDKIIAGNTVLPRVPVVNNVPPKASKKKKKPRIPISKRKMHIPVAINAPTKTNKKKKIPQNQIINNPQVKPTKNKIKNSVPKGLNKNKFNFSTARINIMPNLTVTTITNNKNNRNWAVETNRKRPDRNVTVNNSKPNLFTMNGTSENKKRKKNRGRNKKIKL